MSNYILGDDNMNTNGISNSKFTYNLLKKGLDASSTRGKVISNNIANVNTKGYKAYYVNFEDSLKKNEEELDLKATNTRHFKLNESEFGSINIEREKGYNMRHDGNSVDIESEMMNQAMNELMYNSLVSQVNNRISSRRYIINEGR